MPCHGLGLDVSVFFRQRGVDHSYYENSVAKIDTESQAGFYDWFVDGVDHLFQEWFWLGVGNNPEVSVDNFFFSEQVSDTDLDGFDDTLVAVFRNDGLWEMKVRFSLLGSNFGYSDMAEQIRVTNLSQQTQTFRLYEYTDFDLNSNTNDLWGDVLPPVLAEQYGEGILAQVSTTPFAFWWMADFPNIVNKLNDGVADTLPNVTSPFFGPRDISFALQWNRTLAPGREFIVSKDKIISRVIPEPSSIVLLGLGGMALGCLGLRRRVV
jgi:hypothetical protein